MPCTLAIGYCNSLVFVVYYVFYQRSLEVKVKGHVRMRRKKKLLTNQDCTFAPGYGDVCRAWLCH